MGVTVFDIGCYARSIIGTPAFVTLEDTKSIIGAAFSLAITDGLILARIYRTTGVSQQPNCTDGSFDSTYWYVSRRLYFDSNSR